LKTSFQHFIQAEWIKAHAAKRGGAQRILSLDELSTAEQEAVIKPVDNAACAPFSTGNGRGSLVSSHRKLKEEFVAAGRAGDFQQLKCFLSLSQPRRKEAYAKVASHLGVKPETIAVAVHRMTRRFRELLCAEIEATVSRPEDVEDELRYLKEVLNSAESG
jgi:RNA polymerase sigma-70 factor (ECF subfamily)